MTNPNRGQLIPKGYERSESFKKDVRFLAELDSATVAEVALLGQALASGQSLSAAMSELSDEALGEIDESPGAMSALAVIQTRAVEHEIEHEQIVDALSELLAVDGEKVSALAQAAVVPEEKRDLILARRSFARPPYFCSSEFHPVLRQIGSRLVPGLEWMISYHDSHDEHVEFTFGMTMTEAETLLEELKEAIEAVRRLRAIDVPSEE